MRTPQADTRGLLITKDSMDDSVFNAAIAAINQKLDFLAHGYTFLHNQLVKKRLPEEQGIINNICSLLKDIQRASSSHLHAVSEECEKFRKESETRETFRMPEEFIELIGTMKFIAKRMHDMEKRLEKWESFDIKHKIKIEIDDSEVQKYNDPKSFALEEHPYDQLFRTLPPKEERALRFEFGIGCVAISRKKMAKLLRVKELSVYSVIKRGLMVCRHKSRSELVKNLPDEELKKRILRQ